MAWVWHRSQAKGMTRLVALAIADHASDDGSNAWPAVSRLAAMCLCSESTVRRAIRELVELGELRVETQAGGPRDLRDDRRPNRYTVLCPQVVDKNVDGVSSVTGRDGHGVSNLVPRGVTVDTLTIHNHPASKSFAVSTVQNGWPVDKSSNGDEWEPLSKEHRELGKARVAEIREHRLRAASGGRRGESNAQVVPDTDDDPIGA